MLPNKLSFLDNLLNNEQDQHIEELINEVEKQILCESSSKENSNEELYFNESKEQIEPEFKQNCAHLASQEAEVDESDSYSRYDLEGDNHEHVVVEEVVSASASKEEIPEYEKNIPLSAYVESNPLDGTITITYKGKTTALRVRGTVAYFESISQECGYLFDVSPGQNDPGIDQEKLLAQHSEQVKFVRSLLISLIPVVGNIKAFYEVSFNQDLTFKKRLIMLGLLALPHAKKITHAIRYGRLAARSFLKGLNTKLPTYLGRLYSRLPSVTTAKPGFVKLAGETVEISTKEAAEKIATVFKGTVELAEGKGWRILLPGKNPILVRIMNAYSGGRTKPYFRAGVPGKGCFTLQGKLSDDRALTHIDLTENYLEQIEDMISKYLKGKK